MKRRSFLKTAAATALGIQIIPRHVLGGDGHTPPSEKLNLASIGVGGQGGQRYRQPRRGADQHDCRVRRGRSEIAMPPPAAFPGQRRLPTGANCWIGWTRQIDAVSVSTPDHMHAPISMSAIHRGKHVYCQKPMTHTIHEARQIAAAARKAKVVTQMGIQIHSSIEYRMATELIQAGAIGKIKEVHSWSDRPGWPQGRPRPKGQSPVPKELNWDLWLGVAPERPFVAGRLCAVRVAGDLGLRLRGPGRHGLPYHRPAFHGLEADQPQRRLGRRTRLHRRHAPGMGDHSL